MSPANKGNPFLISKFTAPKIAIGVAFLLALGKGAVGYVTGSLAVISSAFDSLLDIVSSSLNYLMIRKADAPPDAGHQFGHGKLEAYASLIQSIVIFFTGGFLLYVAVKKIRTPSLPEVTAISSVVMVIAIIASFFITTMLRRVAKREKSPALEADALHYFVDILSNSCVLITLLIIKFTGIKWVDPLMGGLIGIYIMHSAVKLHLSALRILLDGRVPKDQLDTIVDAFKQFEPYQQNFHRLRTRTDGNRIFADVHVTLCKTLTLEQAHDLIDIIEDSMPGDCKNLDMVVHAEPCDGSCLNTPSCKKEAVLELLARKKAEQEEAC